MTRKVSNNYLESQLGILLLYIRQEHIHLSSSITQDHVSASATKQSLLRLLKNYTRRMIVFIISFSEHKKYY